MNVKGADARVTINYRLPLGKFKRPITKAQVGLRGAKTASARKLIGFLIE